MASLTGAVEAPRVLLRDVKGHEQEGGDGKNRFSSKIQSIALLLGFSKSWFGFFDVFAVTARWFGSKRFLLL